MTVNAKSKTRGTMTTLHIIHTRYLSLKVSLDTFGESKLEFKIWTYNHGNKENQK